MSKSKFSGAELILVCRSAHSNRCTISWEDEDARYHVWVDKDGDLESTIYKNPLNATAPSDPDFYYARNLHLGAECYTGLVERLKRLSRPEKLEWAIRNLKLRYEKAELFKKKERISLIRAALLEWIGDGAIDASCVEVLDADRLLKLQGLMANS